MTTEVERRAHIDTQLETYAGWPDHAHLAIRLTIDNIRFLRTALSPPDALRKTLE